MPHRVKNEHNARHHTHAVKPANQYIGPLGQTVKPVVAPVPVLQAPEVVEAPTAVETVVAAI